MKPKNPNLETALVLWSKLDPDKQTRLRQKLGDLPQEPKDFIDAAFQMLGGFTEFVKFVETGPESDEYEPCFNLKTGVIVRERKPPTPSFKEYLNPDVFEWLPEAQDPDLEMALILWTGVSIEKQERLRQKLVDIWKATIYEKQDTDDLWVSFLQDAREEASFENTIQGFQHPREFVALAIWLLGGYMEFVRFVEADLPESPKIPVTKRTANMDNTYYDIALEWGNLGLIHKRYVQDKILNLCIEHYLDKVEMPLEYKTAFTLMQNLVDDIRVLLAPHIQEHPDLFVDEAIKMIQGLSDILDPVKVIRNYIEEALITLSKDVEKL